MVIANDVTDLSATTALLTVERADVLRARALPV